MDVLFLHVPDGAHLTGMICYCLLARLIASLISREDAPNGSEPGRRLDSRPSFIISYRRIKAISQGVSRFPQMLLGGRRL